MKANEVKIGSVYQAKVSDRETEVRIESATADGGWRATNLSSGRVVRIKAAEDLSEPVAAAADATAVSTAVSDDPKPSAASSTRKSPAPTGTKDDGAKKSVKTPAKDSGKKSGTRAKPSSNSCIQKRAGILDVAAGILSKTSKPMSCKAIVEKAISGGLWKTKGKTPSATLCAAMIREIARKGKEARFKKVDRGLFTSNGNANDR